MNLSIHITTDNHNVIMQDYMIAALKWHWEKTGHRVTYGPLGGIDADLGILHIDRTKISPQVGSYNPSHGRVLNEQVHDISKNTFSTLQVTRNDRWDGPVIIKSDLNSFGFPEWIAQHRSFIARFRRNLARISWRISGTLPPWRYPVLPELSKVPGWVWENPELIVERFMPEREGKFYCLRGWVFFGTKGYTYRLFSKDSMVKAGAVSSYEILGDPPVELEEFRAMKGFDFGKFDYVQIGGKPILLDINKTPTITSIKNNPDTPRMRHLADGLYDFIGGM